MGWERERRLTPYWRRLMDEAKQILSDRIEKLEAETVDPGYCLLEQDKAAMQRRQHDIAGCQSVLETIEKREWGAKFWAVDTVLREKPGMVFGLK